MNDIELRKNVTDELEFEPSIDAADIGVAAEHGVIRLTGHVSSYFQKLAAERATWRVKGVKAIAQDIDVRLPHEKKINDDEIAKRALDILSWNTAVPRNAVKVRVCGGWVTLTGMVTWNYQRKAAETEVRRLTGVLGVLNDISLLPNPQEGDVRQRIVDALKRHAEVESSRIRIDVREDGHVRIEGEVDDWEEREAVQRAVWSAPGVRAVEDHVRIV